MNNDGVIQELKSAEVRYTYALNTGNLDSALNRNQEIYNGLWTLYLESQNPEERFEMCYELERLAMQGLMIQALQNKWNFKVDEEYKILGDVEARIQVQEDYAQLNKPEEKP